MTGRIDFFIVGAQKAGTSALDAMLRKDPRVRMGLKKELHFFDNDGLAWDDPPYDHYHRRFGRLSEHVRVSGEATPIYGYWPNCLERIARYNPDARLIFSLRHPAWRAHSHWRMQVARGAETMSFAEAVSEAGRRRVRHAGRSVHRHFSYVERGFYATQIERALSLFPAENVHVLRMDDLWARPAETLDRLLGFLGLSPSSVEYTSEYTIKFDARHVWDPDMERRAALTSLFLDDIRRTERLIGLDLSDWLDPGYAEAVEPFAVLAAAATLVDRGRPGRAPDLPARTPVDPLVRARSFGAFSGASRSRG